MASYLKGIAYIALNDEPEDRDPESVADYISVGLLAEVFNKPSDVVGADVVKFRIKHGV